MCPKGKMLTLEDIFVRKELEPATYQPSQNELPIAVQEAIKNFLGSPIDKGNCHWNDDQTYLLFETDKEAIYRRSTKENVFILTMASSHIQKIGRKKISHATFSPDGKMVAYCEHNDIFIYVLSEKKTVRVTCDGKKNQVINGSCDWVYEEEFAFSRAYAWSPDSKMLAFYRFDESRVREYTFPIYDDGYNQNYSYKYPKAGEENAVVTIHGFYIDTHRTNTFSTHSDGGYIPKINWSPDNRLYIFHLNRHQNTLRIWQHDPTTAKAEIYYSENDDRYIDLTEDWYFMPNNELVYTSECSGFRNIYWQKSDKTTKSLTNNPFDLSHIVAIDFSKQWIYFVAAYPNPMERHLFVVDFNGTQQRLSNKEGWNVVYIDKDYTTVTIENSNIREPASVDQYKILSDNDHLPFLQHEKNLLDNTQLKTTLAHYHLQQPAFAQIPIGEKNYLNSWVLLPQGFDEQKQYPLLLCNYGGPGSQTVVNKYGAVSLWHQYMAQNGFIVVSVDNTGTGFRGEDFKKKTYLQLGKLEIEDQIKAAAYFSKLPYVHSDKIGHWGWSFGGFMSCLAITKGASIFRYAVAIAPVTSWRYYDTIYTERYMRSPVDNEDGYEDNTPFTFLDNMKGKLLLIHGSADDNVHLQHTMQLSKRLTEKNIPFDMIIYPNKNHRITGGNTTIHLFEKTTKWLFAHS